MASAARSDFEAVLAELRHAETGCRIVRKSESLLRNFEKGIEAGVRILVDGHDPHEWANAIETADTRFGLTLKDGVGPMSMVTYFALAAKQLQAQELGHTVDRATLEAFREARELVVHEGYYKK